MHTYLELKDSTGQPLLIEITEKMPLQPTGRPREMRDVGVADTTRKLIDASVEQIEKGIGALGKLTTSVLKSFKEAAPNEIEIELGVKVSADANVILSSVGGEANFVVKLKWTNP